MLYTYIRFKREKNKTNHIWDFEPIQWIEISGLVPRNFPCIVVRCVRYNRKLRMGLWLVSFMQWHNIKISCTSHLIDCFECHAKYFSWSQHIFNDVLIRTTICWLNNILQKYMCVCACKLNIEFYRHEISQSLIYNACTYILYRHRHNLFYN